MKERSSNAFVIMVAVTKGRSRWLASLRVQSLNASYSEPSNGVSNPARLSKMPSGQYAASTRRHYQLSGLNKLNTSIFSTHPGFSYHVQAV